MDLRGVCRVHGRVDRMVSAASANLHAREHLAVLGVPMSLPFAALCAQRSTQLTDAELTEHAFRTFNRWAMLSSSKLVSLDEVAWAGALLLKAMKSAGIDIMKVETRDENGARVVGVVASDGVNVKDGAS
jgi:hypothetical protein